MSQAVIARGVNGIRDLNRRQIQIVSVTSMLVFLSTLAVALRLVSRRISIRHISPDDYVIVFALVRNMPSALRYGSLSPVSSYFHMETVSANLLVSRSTNVANITHKT